MLEDKENDIIDVEFVAESEQISEKKLKFYEKLRDKISGFANEKAGEKVGKFTEYVLALPDFFILLCRLAVDKRVKNSQKVMIGGIIVYVMSPIDLIPDFIPVIGYVDDIVLVVFGLNMLFNELDNQILLDNWSGKQDVLGLLQKVSAAAEDFLNKNVLQKIKKFLQKFDKK
ncbi:MAG: YkvA family protein [Candidatus Cloacimonadales bacterium]|nr:YkvA family protein [Candidatus Cloacimonadales bacterium]